MTTDFPRLPCTCGFQPDGTFERDCPGCVLYRRQVLQDALHSPRDPLPTLDTLDTLRQRSCDAEAALQTLCEERAATPYGPDRQRLTVQVHNALEKVKRCKAALTKQQRLLATNQKG